jgi:hypothetical protein
MYDTPSRMAECDDRDAASRHQHGHHVLACADGTHVSHREGLPTPQVLSTCERVGAHRTCRHGPRMGEMFECCGEAVNRKSGACPLSNNSPVTLEDLEPFGLASVAKNAGTKEVEQPSTVDAQEREGGAPPVYRSGRCASPGRWPLERLREPCPWPLRPTRWSPWPGCKACVAKRELERDFAYTRRRACAHELPPAAAAKGRARVRDTPSTGEGERTEGATAGRAQTRGVTTRR